MKRSIQRGWRQPTWRNVLLLPVSWMFQGLSAVRSACYTLGLCRRYRLSVPVIVVGAIDTGGSGKTPAVIALVRALREAGYRPGVISRGYGGRSKTWPVRVNALSRAEQVGDEPQLIYETTRAPMAVGPNRVQAGRLLLSEDECDVIVSDDGFQHLALLRDIDIVVLDGEFGLGNGWCLPAGPLRESRQALRRAHFILVNGLADSVSGYYSMHMALENFYNLQTGESRAIAAFTGQRIHAVAGIGKPQRFFSSLDSAGLRIIRHEFDDHHCYHAGDLEFADDHAIVMTEKDGIKCRDFPCADKIWVARTRTELEAAFVDKIVHALQRASCAYRPQ